MSELSSNSSLQMQTPTQKRSLLGPKIVEFVCDAIASSSTPSLAFTSTHYAKQCTVSAAPRSLMHRWIFAASSWIRPCSNATAIVPQIHHHSPNDWLREHLPSCPPRSTDSKIQDVVSKQQRTESSVAAPRTHSFLCPPSLASELYTSPYSFVSAHHPGPASLTRSSHTACTWYFVHTSSALATYSTGTDCLALCSRTAQNRSMLCCKGVYSRKSSTVTQLAHRTTDRCRRFWA